MEALAAGSPTSSPTPSTLAISDPAPPTTLRPLMSTALLPAVSLPPSLALGCHWPFQVSGSHPNSHPQTGGPLCLPGHPLCTPPTGLLDITGVYYSSLSILSGQHWGTGHSKGSGLALWALSLWSRTQHVAQRGELRSQPSPQVWV